MYELIKRQPPVRKVYADKLVEEGVISAEEAGKMADDAYGVVAAAHTELKESMAGPPETGAHEIDRTMSREPKTTLPEDLLRSLNEQLVRVPDGFQVHRKLKPFLEKRREALDGGPVDWAHAEALAFASLLALGVPVRLTGQDTERGTFSQRHLVLHDAGGEMEPDAGGAPRDTARCRPSSCTTARCPSRPASGSSTATACRTPTRWFSGRPSSATS
jgi:2-oxoglutarate dehydrogenase E1 component